jgi:hypothetical protein
LYNIAKYYYMPLKELSTNKIAKYYYKPLYENIKDMGTELKNKFPTLLKKKQFNRYDFTQLLNAPEFVDLLNKHGFDKLPYLYDNIPSSQYGGSASSAAAASDEEDMCCICMDKIVRNLFTHTIPGSHVEHKYHDYCLREWVIKRGNNDSPLRIPVEKKDRLFLERLVVGKEEKAKVESVNWGYVSTMADGLCSVASFFVKKETVDNVRQTVGNVGQAIYDNRHEILAAMQAAALEARAERRAEEAAERAARAARRAERQRREQEQAAANVLYRNKIIALILFILLFTVGVTCVFDE